MTDKDSVGGSALPTSGAARPASLTPTDTAATLGYPVQLTKLEARLLLGMLTNPAYQSLKDYDETVKPLIVKLEAVL